jgi:hypothetical protein
MYLRSNLSEASRKADLWIISTKAKLEYFTQ